MFGISERNTRIPEHFQGSNALLKEAHVTLLDEDKNCCLRRLEGVMLSVQAFVVRIFEAGKYLIVTCVGIGLNLIALRPGDALYSLFQLPGAVGALITPFEILGRCVGAIFTPKALEGAYLKKPSRGSRPPAPPAAPPASEVPPVTITLGRGETAAPPVSAVPPVTITLGRGETVTPQAVAEKLGAKLQPSGVVELKDGKEITMEEAAKLVGLTIDVVQPPPTPEEIKAKRKAELTAKAVRLDAEVAKDRATVNNHANVLVRAYRLSEARNNGLGGVRAELKDAQLKLVNKEYDVPMVQEYLRKNIEMLKFRIAYILKGKTISKAVELEAQEKDKALCAELKELQATCEAQMTMLDKRKAMVASVATADASKLLTKASNKKEVGTGAEEHEETMEEEPIEGASASSNNNECSNQ